MRYCLLLGIVTALRVPRTPFFPSPIYDPAFFQPITLFQESPRHVQGMTTVAPVKSVQAAPSVHHVVQAAPPVSQTVQPAPSIGPAYRVQSTPSVGPAYHVQPAPSVGPAYNNQPAPSVQAKPITVGTGYELHLDPFVAIGIEAVHPKRAVPANHFAVCPTNRAYCLDYRASDNATCMYPSPVEIKRCYDESCVNSAWGPIVYKQQGEDSYCKDFMTPQGRLCQWVDALPCTCNTKSIMYYDAEFVPNGGDIPVGFAKPDLCVYPLDLIRKAADEAALKARDKRNNVTRRPRRKRGEQDEDSSSKKGSQKVQQANDEKSFAKISTGIIFLLLLV